tara:strand:+ start:120 stop:1076 length:957 start_codon:yes stop_codon:yes gene_type:complete
MKIINLLYFKYLISFLICFVSSFIIFFIFSLIGYLNEEYLFETILKISFLNSIQIITILPIFIFLISVILLNIFLKTNNEISIIKSNLPLKKLLLFFLPIAVIFSLVELNKKNIGTILENSKIKLFNENDKNTLKIIIYEYEDIKNYKIYKNISLNDLENAEYRSFIVSDKEIEIAEFSDDISFNNNNFVINKYYKYKDNSISDSKFKKEIVIDTNDLLNQKSIVVRIYEDSNFRLSFKIANIFIFFCLLTNYIFLLFFNSKFISNKESIRIPITLSLILLIYSFFIFNNNLIFLEKEFEVLGSLLMLIFFFKASINE